MSATPPVVREIRLAQTSDVPAIRACVEAAYALYRARMNREPAPVSADYPTLVARNVIWVLETSAGIQGVIALFPKDQALFIENVAVHPDAQGRGYGALLLRFADDQARARGLTTLTLYTNALMTENLGFYAHLGYTETERRLEDGYHRVFLEKRL